MTIETANKKDDAIAEVKTLSGGDIPEINVTPETDAMMQLLSLGIPQKEAENAIKIFGINNIDKAADYCLRVQIFVLNSKKQ